MFRVTITDKNGTVITAWDLDLMAEDIIIAAASDFPDEPIIEKPQALRDAVREMEEELRAVLFHRLKRGS